MIAIEANPLLYAVTSSRPIATGDAAVDDALARVEVKLGEHTELLSTMDDRSADVVYFDPMFRRSAKSASGFDVIRSLARSNRLTSEAIEQARRVARRAVVVMDQHMERPQSEQGSESGGDEGGELERL